MKNWLYWIPTRRNKNLHKFKFQFRYSTLGLAALILLSGCYNRKPESLRLIEKPIAEIGDLECKAKGNIKGKVENDSFTAPFILKLSRKSKETDLKIVIYGPFLTPEAKIILNSKERYYEDSSGRHQISKSSFFSHWFKSNWQRDIIFMLGKIIPSHRGKIFTDQLNRPRLLADGLRQIDCQYDDENQIGPNRCTVNEGDLKLNLNFSSSGC